MFYMHRGIWFAQNAQRCSKWVTGGTCAIHTLIRMQRPLIESQRVAMVRGECQVCLDLTEEDSMRQEH